MTILNIDKIISSAMNVINHFPCDKPHLSNMIKELRSVNRNAMFELKEHSSTKTELVIQGLETGLDIEQYFPLRDDVTDDYKNIHSCSVFFDSQSNVENIIFTLTSNSRSVSFEVEFNSDFVFKWYEMFYFNPDKLFGTCDDSILSLKDEMSYLPC
jgi:hypothetical protein